MRLVIIVCGGVDEDMLFIGGQNNFPLWEDVFVHVLSGVGVNSGIEWELSSIPDSIPGIGLGIGIEKKGIGIELELTKNARN